MFEFLARFILARRHFILAVLGLVFAICLVAVPQLEFNFTPQQLFESTDDAHEYREVFAERFGREDNAVTILVKGEDLWRPEVLAPMRDLTYELRLHPQVVDAQSLATIALPRPDSLSAEPHLGSLSKIMSASDGRPLKGPAVTDDQAQSLRHFASDEPLIAGRLINHDGSMGLIAAWLHRDIQEVEDLKSMVEEFHGIVDAYDFPDDVHLQIEGIPPLRVTIVDHLRQEQVTFVPLTAFIFFLILLYLFRRPSGYILPLAVVVFALTATVALLVVTGSSINIINNVLPTLIFVIGISDSIHMITRHTEEVEVGKSHQEAVRAMIRHTGAACLLTTSTTAIGFLSLLSARTQILQDFGWQAAAGVMFAYLATLLLLSSALIFLKPARRGRVPRADESPTSPPLLERLLMALGRRLLDHPWTVITVGLLIAGTIAFQGTRVDIDTTILEVFHEDHPTFQSTMEIERELGGILPFEISLEAEDRDHFKNPDIYAAVHAVQTFAKEHPTVLSTESYVDYLQTARVAVTGDVDQRFRLAENTAQLEQLLLIISDAPDTQGGLSNFVTDDFRNARILLRVADSGANSHLALAEDLQAELAHHFDGTDTNYTLTGDAYVASAALNSFIRDLMVSLFIAIGVIFILMTLVFRSLKIGIISLLPNCLPLFVAYGYMGIADINLNTTTIIIFAISLGIAVDDSIHFFARFTEEKKRHDDLKTAILHTYYGAGRAILLTSLLLIIGMSVLTLSDFVPTQQFGLLTGITIASAVLADLFILPPLLYLVYSRFPSTPDGGPIEAGAKRTDDELPSSLDVGST